MNDFCEMNVFLDSGLDLKSERVMNGENDEDEIGKLA